MLFSQTTQVGYSFVAPWAQDSLDYFENTYYAFDFQYYGKLSTEKITREEYAEVLGKSYLIISGITDLTLNRQSYFSDTKSEWIAIVSNLGLITGTGSTTFNPNKHITREEIAVSLYNLNKILLLPEDTNSSVNIVDSDDISTWAKESVRFCVNSNIINGLPDGRIAPKHNATIEQSIAILGNFIERAIEYADNHKISIEDPYISASASISLSNSKNYLTLRDAYKLTTLDIEGKGVKNLEGIQNFINLSYLNISNNDLTNIDQISHLRNLFALHLSNNNIEDVSSIQNSVNLIKLYINNNKIKKFPNLSNLLWLDTIDAENNLIESLEELSTAPNIKYLSVQNNKVLSLETQQIFKKLSRLNLENNKLHNLKGVQDYGHLYQLIVDGNPLDNIDDLKSISNLDGYFSIMGVDYTRHTINKAVPIFNEIKNILKYTINDASSDYDKAKALHDYIVLNFEYDYENYLLNNIPSESYTVVGLFSNRKGVCQAYALAYNLLLKNVGIESYFVSGFGDGGGHAWNYVIIDGVGYHVDTTWDDPVPNRPGYVRHNYFMLTDEQIGRDHSNWVIMGYSN